MSPIKLIHIDLLPVILLYRMYHILYCSISYCTILWHKQSQYGTIFTVQFCTACTVHSLWLLVMASDCTWYNCVYLYCICIFYKLLQTYLLTTGTSLPFADEWRPILLKFGNFCFTIIWLCEWNDYQSAIRYYVM